MTSDGKCSGGPDNTHWESSAGPGEKSSAGLVDQGESSGGHGEKSSAGLVDQGEREFYWSGGPREKNSGGPGGKCFGGHGEKRVLLVWWTREKENSAGLLDQGKRESYWSGGPGKKRVLLLWWTRGKENSGGPGEREFCWSGGPGKREFCWSGGPGEKRILLVWWTRGKESSTGLVDQGKRVLLVWWTWGKEFYWSGGPGEMRILLVLQTIFCDHRPLDQWEFWFLANVCVVWSQALGTRYLEWPEDYTLEKVLPLTTLWDQLDISSGSPPTASDHLKPSRCGWLLGLIPEFCFHNLWPLRFIWSLSFAPTASDHSGLFDPRFGSYDPWVCSHSLWPLVHLIPKFCFHSLWLFWFTWSPSFASTASGSFDPQFGSFDTQVLLPQPLTTGSFDPWFGSLDPWVCSYGLWPLWFIWSPIWFIYPQVCSHRLTTHFIWSLSFAPTASDHFSLFDPIGSH